MAPLNAFRIYLLSADVFSGSHTPPRKVARLEGDEDCSTTAGGNRTVEDEEDLFRSKPTKGKGKGKDKDGSKDGAGVTVAQRVVVDRPPGMCYRINQFIIPHTPFPEC